MIPIHKLEAAVILGSLTIGALLAIGWERDHQRMLRAEAVAQERQKGIDARDRTIRTRDASAKTYDAAIDKQAAAIKTPQQAVQVIVRYLHDQAPAGSPAAASAQAQAAPVTVDRAQLSPELQKELPDSPHATLFTDDQVEQLGKDALVCDKATHDLVTCRADAKDLRANVAAEQANAATWKAAARGGTRLQRLARVVKYVACAGAGAAAGQYIDKQSPAAGAAIGSAAAVSTCAIF